MKIAAAIALMFVAVYIAPLGVRPMTAPDETRYAEIPREMVARGDWVVPRLCGLRYFEKTPMGYWLTATSITVFGENRFAIRLASALATGATALLIALLAMRATGSSRPALWSAFAFLTMPFVFALGVTNVLDAPFSLFVTATIVTAFLGLEEPRRARRLSWYAAAGAAAGAAFLVKGFLAFVLPAIVVGPYLVTQRRWRDLFALPWVPMAVAILFILPWAIAIHLREPDYWRYFVMEEHIQRFLDPSVGQHPEPFWFLLPYLVGGPLAWTFLSPALAKGIPAAWTAQRRLVLFCAIWLAAPFLFFSVSSGKLPTYILPCFAPLAILIGIGAQQVADAAPGRLLRSACIVCAIPAAVGLFIVSAAALLPASMRVFSAEETAKTVLAIAALALWLALAAAAAFAKNAGRALVLAGVAATPFLASLHFIIPNRSLDRKAPERVLDESVGIVTTDTVFYTDVYLAPAASWKFKTENICVSGIGEMAYGLSYPDDAHRAVNDEHIIRILADPRRKHDAAILLQNRRMNKLRPSMPPPDQTRTANGISLLFYKAPPPTDS